MDMTVSRNDSCDSSSSHHNSDRTPPRLHHSKPYYPPNSPIVIAQAQSTILSPTRADSLSPPDSRHNVLSAAPQCSSSNNDNCQQRQQSPDSQSSVGSSSPHSFLHPDELSSASSQPVRKSPVRMLTNKQFSNIECHMEMPERVNSYPREQLDQSTRFPFAAAAKNVNEESTVNVERNSPTSSNFREPLDSSSEEQQQKPLFKVPHQILPQMRVHGSNGKQKFFYSTDVLQQLKQQKRNGNHLIKHDQEDENNRFCMQQQQHQALPSIVVRRRISAQSDEDSVRENLTSNEASPRIYLQHHSSFSRGAPLHLLNQKQMFLNQSDSDLVQNGPKSGVTFSDDALNVGEGSSNRIEAVKMMKRYDEDACVTMRATPSSSSSVIHRDTRTLPTPPPALTLQEPNPTVDPTHYAIIDYSRPQYNNGSDIDTIETNPNNDMMLRQHQQHLHEQQFRGRSVMVKQEELYSDEELIHHNNNEVTIRRRVVRHISPPPLITSTDHHHQYVNSNNRMSPSSSSAPSMHISSADNCYLSSSNNMINTPSSSTNHTSTSSATVYHDNSNNRGYMQVNHNRPHHEGLMCPPPSVVIPNHEDRSGGCPVGAVSSSFSTSSLLSPIPEGEMMSTIEAASNNINGVSSSNSLVAVIDKLIIEFDGTTLLCRVCGDRSSGFHYGVHSCEGCKGFFRRSIQQKIQYRPCSKNQVCHVQKTNRNRCQYCRLKKCIEVGMSKDAVRFGRVPKNEKERIRQAMAKATVNSSPIEISDETLISTITKSHMDTCFVARENVKDILIRADESPRIAAIDPLGNCPLNPYIDSDDFQQKFSPIVREVVTFAKNIPGFIDLKHDDKINLLRACVFEVLLIRFSALIDPKNKRMISISGSIIFTNIYSNIKASSDFVDTLFTFVDRINSLNLSDEEMALFTAAIVVNPKRQNLTDINKITVMHRRIVTCLQNVMERDRPDNPRLSHELLSTLNDLLILNGMHSKQTQAKPRGMDIPTSSHVAESSNKYYNSYNQGCPVQSASSPDYEDKRMVTDEGLPTSPTSNYCQEDAMQSPGSADSGCSVDSGCSSAESDISYDSGCSVRHHTLVSETQREVLSTEEELSECRTYVKRKPIVSNSGDSRSEQEKMRSTSWHKPQSASDKQSDSPVLRMCLEAPSQLKMETFNDYYRGNGSSSHPHKKFRPSVADRPSYSHETLDSCISSPRPSISPSPSFSSSPSPSSSISSSPSRISSSPYSSSSNMSSPASPAISILASRLAMPSKKFNKSSILSQSLRKEPKFGYDKTKVVDVLHDCIMNGQSKVSRQHVLAAPSPSRYDDLRNSSPLSSAVMGNNHHLNSTRMSPPSPYSYSSSPSLMETRIPQAHSPPHHTTPAGLGASAMSGCMVLDSYDSQPLNLSTKTPPPTAMEA